MPAIGPRFKHLLLTNPSNDFQTPASTNGETIRIATWNVNSVKSRLAHLTQWLQEDQPDIVLLQETKCTDDNFPHLEIEALGYKAAIFGEKSYNGVAVLARHPIGEIKHGLPGDEADLACRYIEAVITLPNGSSLRAISVYVPNGQHAESEKFGYKLRFLERLYTHCRSLLSRDEIVVMGGDYNIAPDDALDVHEPVEWQGSVLTHDEVRKYFRALKHLGFYDAFRNVHPMAREFSWWDYRAASFDRDDGLRIDHLLCSPQALDRLVDCVIERKLRALEKASDHTPVIATFSI